MRKHNFIDKHPVGASVLIGFVIFIAIQTIGAFPPAMYEAVTGNEAPLLEMLSMIAATAIVMLIYKKRFSPEYKGVVRLEGLAEGLLMGLPILAYWIIASIPSVIDGTFVVKPLTAQILSSAVVAGVIEEAAFRHGIITTMLRNRNQKENLIKVLLISGTVFGLIHMLNMAIGADPIRTILQSVGAIGFGVFFGAIFVTTGNILPSMILHAVHDIFAIVTSADVSDAGMITAGGVGLSQIIDFACMIALGVFAVIRYMPNDKKDEIVALWNRIWSKD